MKAVVFEKFGGPEVLVMKEVPTPEPKGDEVLIRSRAISVNPVDYKIRSGSAKDRIPVFPPTILGRDVAGEVSAVGSQCTDVKPGDRVMALTSHTYAEYVCVKHTEYNTIPDGMDFETAASLPLVLATGSQLIERAIQLKPGQSVLITGAVGSVGRVAVHVARKLGARVIAGVRLSQKEEARELGVDDVVAIDHIDRLNTIRGMDAVADTVGGDLSMEFMKTIKGGGVYGSLVGPPKNADDFPDIRVALMMAQPDRQRMRELAEDVARGEFTVPIGARFPLAEAAEAQRQFEAHRISGKVLLVP